MTTTFLRLLEVVGEAAQGEAAEQAAKEERLADKEGRPVDKVVKEELSKRAALEAQPVAKAELRADRAELRADRVERPAGKVERPAGKVVKEELSKRAALEAQPAGKVVKGEQVRREVLVELPVGKVAREVSQARPEKGVEVAERSAMNPSLPPISKQ